MLKTCADGHQFQKTSDCPVCPICEQARKPTNSFLALLGAPARRAMENHGISSLSQLAAYAEKEVLKWHGLGPGSLPKLRSALAGAGLGFKEAL